MLGIFSILDKTAMRLASYLPKSDGSELAEFAISLPLLVVLVVGTYDFSGAFTLKQKLNSAAQEGVRIASSQSTRDLSRTIAGCSAASVCLVRDVVHSYLLASKVDDCGLESVAGSGSFPIWTFTATCAAGPLKLTIERGLTYDKPLTSPFPTAYRIEASQVTLEYPYPWQFNRAIKLIVPSANYASAQLVKTSATMQNIN